MTEWFDQHCHLDLDELALEEAVDEARSAGVVGMIDVGCDVDGSRRAIERARRFPGVYATAGVHPHDADGGIDGLDDLCRTGDVVAVGECGLDYHYLRSSEVVQREVFGAQIDLAVACGLPLVIHSRNAWDDTFEILRSRRLPDRVVFHCFTGGLGEAERAVELGAFLSFSGIVTFKNADDLRAAAAWCPPERLLVETDSPYLAPVPHRGRPNRPALVAVVGAAVAEVRGVAVDEIARLTVRNTREFYGLSQP